MDTEDQTPGLAEPATLPYMGQNAERPSRELATEWAAKLAGAAGAGVALAFGELFDGISERVPSLVVAVGDLVVDNADAGTTKWAIDLFGTNDKPALVIGVVAISLLLGSVAGRVGQSRPRLPFIVFGLFGAFGGWAAAQGAQSSMVLSWFAALSAAAAGWITLEVLLRGPVLFHSGPEIAPRRDLGAPLLREAAPASFDRRVFVGGVAGAGAVAVIGAGLGSNLRQRSNVSAERLAVADRIPTPVQATAPTTAVPAGAISYEGLSPYITPTDDFYRIDTAISVPQVNPTDWSLKVGGMVDTPLELTLDDLLNEELVERTVTISCVSNPIGGDLVGNAVWTGVPLDRILARAGVQPGADQIVGRSVDGWTAGFPTSTIDGDRSAMIAVAMNGEPLPIIHGFPARLVVAGLYGYVSATKWLESIELTTWDAFDGYWVPRGWSKLGPIKVTSRIDTPRPGREIAAGPVGIGGVAWAPTRGVGSVEVSIDEGPWQEAELRDNELDETWVRWTFDWDATRGTHQLQVRAFGLAGELQPVGPKSVAPDGAEGWHRVILSVR